MTQTSNPDRKVPTRRISFEESLAGPAQALRRRRRPHPQPPRRRRCRRCSPTARTSSSARCATTATRSPTPSSSARSPASSARRPCTAASTGRSTTASTSSATRPSSIERFTKWGLAHPRADRCRRSPTWPPPPPSSTSPPRSPSSLLTDEETRDLFGHDEVREPVPVARPRGVRAQGGGLRRLQGRRRQRAHAGVDDERSSASASSSAWPLQVVVSLLARPRPPTGRGNLRRSWRALPPLADRAAASCGASCRTTTGPTSTPTTATPPSWSSSGGPSCSATHGTLNDKLRHGAAA